MSERAVCGPPSATEHKKMEGAIIAKLLKSNDKVYAERNLLVIGANGEQLGVTGSSQGGALSVVTAALDNRITFYAAIHPALCDHSAFLKKRAGGWPHYFYYNTTPSKEQIETSKYYDTVNFARLLKVPGWFSWGYNDNVCPPTSMFSAYNIITSPKELHPYLETGHYWYQEQYDEWQNWLFEKLGIE